jgi:hypothetical protein
VKKFNLILYSALIPLFSFPFFLRFLQNTHLQTPIIIDHLCTDIDQIPEQWIVKAKEDFRVAYGHTSHGSQIISGMEALSSQSELYSFNYDGSDGALSLYDQEPWGDLGNPNRTEWYYLTRNLLTSPGCDRNLIMWSWCSQVGVSSVNDINTYLNLMDQLEQEFPQVMFVYMTGHLDGKGEDGNLHKRNNQIREFCRTNNKVLFDFADIESYDPDGNYFLDKGADEGCNYDSDGDGTRESNWAEEWCAANPGECSNCNCAHSHSLNCDLKGKAFWWMMARLAGWEEESCDINGDGYVDRLDLIEKQADMFQEMEDWIEDCWNTMDDCADINGDGIVDEADLQEKQKQVSQKLMEWMESCGFQKKGRIKR